MSTAGRTDPDLSPRTVSRAELSARQQSALVIGDALQRIRNGNDAAGRHVVVLDDDPTGSQVVHHVPVLTRWEDADLHWAFAHAARTFFILTNTRSIDAPAAAELLLDLDARLQRVAAQRDARFVVISRSDSTLRGHFALETDVAFGYSASDLTDWVEEKTGGVISAADVVSLSLDDIRSGGVVRVTGVLTGARHGVVVVVNTLEASDLEVVVLALLAAESQGWRVICRVGPSSVPVRVGMDRNPPLTAPEIFQGHELAGNGLVVVGSHVDLTTRQLTELLKLPGTALVQLAVDALLDPSSERVEIDRACMEVIRAAAGGDIVLATNRDRVVVETGESSLDLSRHVSTALVEITRRAAAEVGFAWVVAQGGITSHDIATDGLGIPRATVLGQLFPGAVSVWRSDTTGDEQRATASVGLPFVVFPGNVGDDRPSPGGGVCGTDRCQRPGRHGGKRARDRRLTAPPRPGPAVAAERGFLGTAGAAGGLGTAASRAVGGAVAQGRQGQRQHRASRRVPGCVRTGIAGSATFGRHRVATGGRARRRSTGRAREGDGTRRTTARRQHPRPDSNLDSQPVPSQ